MNRTFRLATTAVVLISVSACATYVGDKLLKLPEESVAYDQSRIVAKAKRGVSDMLEILGLPEERKASFKKISPRGVIRDDQPLKLTGVHHQLIIAEADTNIGFATDSIIISGGPLHISHSGNNIVICGRDVDISHDGSLRARRSLNSSSGKGGSLIISKGKINIGHAGNSLIYALNGVEISNAHNVRAFNTSDREISWGHINNIVVDPLFQKEKAPNRATRGHID